MAGWVTTAFTLILVGLTLLGSGVSPRARDQRQCVVFVPSEEPAKFFL